VLQVSQEHSNIRPRKSEFACSATFKLASAGAVELRNALSSHFGLELPATVTFDYPTPAALASFLAEAAQPRADVALDAASLASWESASSLAVCSSSEVQDHETPVISACHCCTAGCLLVSCHTSHDECLFILMADVDETCSF